jgi:hypothetical protein
VSRADLEAEVAGSTAPSMNRSGFEHGTTEADTATAGEPRSLVEAHRRIYDLSARVKELETALRRREYSDAIRDIEDRAILRDLDVKAALLRRTGPIYRVLRYLVRVSMRCLRGLRRLLRRGGQ